MSILLDALKKAEEQRQLGKTPTLQTQVFGDGYRADNNKIWIPALMLLLTAGVIGWTGLVQFHRAEPVAGGLESTPELSQQQARADIPLPDRVVSSERSAKTPVMDFTAANSTSSAEKKETSRSRTNDANSATVQRGVDLPNTEESQVASSDTITPLGKRNKPGKSTRQNQADAEESLVDQSISYWQVPQSVRESMPELKITVLVYAERPEDRFLLINGERLREKEALGDGLVLQEIHRERAIFSFRSYRFHLQN